MRKAALPFGKTALGAGLRVSDTPCDDGTGGMPHAIAGRSANCRSVGLCSAWGHDVEVSGWTPAGHLAAVLRRVD